ncbi:MAG: hypothetical protein ACOYOZ_15895, partial [Pirellula sp.]
APKGHEEIAQGRAKRRPGYIGKLVYAPLGSALSGLGLFRAVRTHGVALGYHLAPRWGKRTHWIANKKPATIPSR